MLDLELLQSVSNGYLSSICIYINETYLLIFVDWQANHKIVFGYQQLTVAVS